MANTYPAFNQLLGSEPDDFDDLQIDRAIDGTGYGRAFFAARKRRFTLRHMLSLAEYATLLAFYDANRTIPVDLVWKHDGATYTNLLLALPKKLTPRKPDVIEVEVTLEPL